jgi:PleD family two-component response regulator
VGVVPFLRLALANVPTWEARLVTAFADSIRRQVWRPDDTVRRAPATPSSTSHPGGRILIVEDDPRNSKLRRALLTGRGHRISEVGDAVPALISIAETTPRPIVTDLSAAWGGPSHAHRSPRFSE